jgi:hemerythrin superfamily protein
MPRSTGTTSKNTPGTTSKAKLAKPNKSSKAGKPSLAPAEAKDAIALLEADHREVEELFERFEQTTGDATKRDLANAICVALKVHARLEEELFYPAAFAAVKDKSLLDEARVEHASAKDLIAQIEAGAPGEALYDARVRVLAEYIDHHVMEEEDEIFPQCRAAKMDLEGLGRILALRKQELMAGFVVSNPILALS